MAGSDRPLARLAPELIDGLLEQVLSESRREAVEIVRRRLTAALVDELEARLQAGGRAPAPPAGSQAVTPTGFYLYGLTWAGAADPPPPVPGVDGTELSAVTVDDLAAIVSPVEDGGAWGVGPGGEVDLEELEPRARAHERVLEEMLGRGPVIPLRFGVMYPDLERVTALLRHRMPALTDTLRRVDGHEEWGLTVHLDGVDPIGPEIGSGARGREYLERRRAERAHTEERRRETAGFARTVHDALLDVAADAAVLPLRPSDGDGAGEARVTVLRAAYLVPAAEAARFRSAAEAALERAPAGVQAGGELTGPWPPYHFTQCPLDEVPA